MKTALLSVPLVLVLAVNQASAQQPTEVELAQRIEILELKLQLAEQQIKQLENECESLRKENATLKQEQGGSTESAEDPFAEGVVWAGRVKFYGSDKGPPWAISISKRNGNKFEGAVATVNREGEKFEFPVSGTAPREGNGVVVVESPTIGRAKLFARGTLRNGAVALSISTTDAFGKKKFADASLVPKK